MGYIINGATKEALAATKTESSSKPFPFLPGGKWANYTARVVKVEEAIDATGNGNDQIMVRVQNGEYECRLYVSIDPSRVGPNCQNVQETIQRNLDRLLKLGKALDIIVTRGNNLEIEPKAFDKAIGKIVSIGVAGAVENGRPKLNAKNYQIINTSFVGLAPELLPVAVPTWAQGAASQGSTASVQDFGGADIPF